MGVRRSTPRSRALGALLLLCSLAGCSGAAGSAPAFSSGPSEAQLPASQELGPAGAPAPSAPRLVGGPPDAGAPGVDGLDALDALDVLAGLVVEPPHMGAPVYDRDQWPGWTDSDGDGCDTRQDVLQAEALVPPATSVGCALVGGQWESPYDGVATSDAGALDIDHVVALAEAHRSGAWAWDDARRAAYANDTDDARALAAVSASSNRSKGDRDPAGWLPDRGVCPYIGAWIAVKARWGLSVDAEEATELSDLLLGPCAGLTVEPWPAAVVPPPR